MQGASTNAHVSPVSWVKGQMLVNRTGEVWAINAWVVERAQGRIVLEEDRSSKSLEALALFLKSLGMPGP